MNHTNRTITQPLIWVALLALLIMSPTTTCTAADQEANDAAPLEEALPATTINYQNYSGLADLVTMICDDALDRFQGFYGPTVVTVEPFTTLGFFEKNKQSELGLTLADQMTAIINNDTLNNHGRARGKTRQSLRGLLQEVDGYLRIHISGVNAAGKRTSYVVSVEMSEPIYRALHTYL